MSDDDLIERYLETGDEALLATLSPAVSDELKATRVLLAEPAVWEEPSIDLPDRIVAAVRATPQIGAPEVTPVRDLSATREKRRSMWASRGVAAAIGLAAGIVLAVSVASLGGGSDDGDELALVATDLAADASGSATVAERAAGFEIVLDIDGLDRAPAGFFYQGWVKGPKGLVTIGTFHTGGHVVLWSGVDLADYDTLTITLEPEDGDPASSGQLLLSAPLHP